MMRKRAMLSISLFLPLQLNAGWFDEVVAAIDGYDHEFGLQGAPPITLSSFRALPSEAKVPAFVIGLTGDMIQSQDRPQ